MIPDTSLGGIDVPDEYFFLLCGFMAGDCLTDLAGFFCVGIVFLRVFRAGPEPEADERGLYSRLRSTGEVVSDVSELRRAPYTEDWLVWFLASSAGDVKGLKLSPGSARS